MHALIRKTLSKTWRGGRRGLGALWIGAGIWIGVCAGAAAGATTGATELATNLPEDAPERDAVAVMAPWGVTPRVRVHLPVSPEDYTHPRVKRLYREGMVLEEASDPPELWLIQQFHTVRTPEALVADYSAVQSRHGSRVLRETLAAQALCRLQVAQWRQQGIDAPPDPRWQAAWAMLATAPADTEAGFCLSLAVAALDHWRQRAVARPLWLEILAHQRDRIIGLVALEVGDTDAAWRPADRAWRALSAMATTPGDPLMRAIGAWRASMREGAHGAG